MSAVPENQSKEFATAIGALCASFGTDASPALLLGYWLGLRDLGLPVLHKAIERAIRECDHLPKPAELRKLSGEHTKESRSATAWNDVQRALPLGPYKHIDFQDKLINAVIRNLGGWPNFVSRFTDADAEKWVRIEFIKCYEAFAQTGVNGELCAPLIGLSQKEGCGGVVSDPIPRLIECEPDRQKMIEAKPNPLSLARLG